LRIAAVRHPLYKVPVGRNEIRAYVRRSRQTIAAWIDAEGFPARNIHGVWESDTDLVDAWRRKKILNRLKEDGGVTHV